MKARHAAETLALGSVVASPWLFGGVEPLFAMGFVVPLLLAWMCALVAWRRGELRLTLPALMLPGLLMIAWGLLQLAPVAGWVGSTSLDQLRSDQSVALASDAVGAEAPEDRPRASWSKTISLHPTATLRHLAWLVVWVGTAGLVACLADRQAVRARWLAAIALGGAAVAVFACVQSLSWNGHIYWIGPELRRKMPAIGPFVYHNQAANFFCLSLAAGLGWVLASAPSFKAERRTGWLRRWAPGIAIALATAGLVGSNSRGALVCGFAAVCLAALAVAKTRGADRRPLWLSLVIGGATVAVLLAISLGSGAKRYGTLFDETALGADSRIAHWRDALQGVADHWGLGVGLGVYPVYGPTLQTTPNRFQFTHAHCQYLETLIEGGWPALVLLLWGTGWALLRGWRLAGSLETVALGGACIAAVAFQALHATVDYCGILPANGLTFAALVGLAAGAGDGGPARRSRLATLGGATFALLLLAACFILQRHAAADSALLKLARSGARAETRAAVAQAIQLLEQAQQFGPQDPQVWEAIGGLRVAAYRLAARDALAQELKLPTSDPRLLRFNDPMFLRAKLAEYRAAGDAKRLSEGRSQPLVQEHLVPALKAYRKAVAGCPLLPRPYLELAKLAPMFEPDSDSQRLTLAAARLAPQDAELLMRAGNLLFVDGHPESMAGVWKRALEIDPQLAREVLLRSRSVLPLEAVVERVLPDSIEGMVKIASDQLPGEAYAELRNATLRKAINRLEQINTPTPEEQAILGRATALLGEPSRAIEAYQAALRRRPDRHVWRFELGEIYLSAGETQLAIEQFKACTGLRPSIPRYAGALRAALAKGKAP